MNKHWEGLIMTVVKTKNLITRESVLADIKKTQELLEWVIADDSDAFLTINTHKATLEMDEDLLELIELNGVKPRTFAQDEAGNILRIRAVHNKWVPRLIVLPDGKKVWLKFTEDKLTGNLTLDKTKLNKFGLTLVSVDVPVFYKLVGQELGNVSVIEYQAPYNHVTGESNPFWKN